MQYKLLNDIVELYEDLSEEPKYFFSKSELIELDLSTSGVAIVWFYDFDILKTVSLLCDENGKPMLQSFFEC
jgi:hypothetical protein